MTTNVDNDTLVIPFLDHCSMERPQMGEGRCRVEIPARPELTNSLGMVHGGMLMTLLDAAMGGACRSLLGVGVSVVTIDMQVTFLSPARGRVAAEGRVVRATRSMIFAQAEVIDADGAVATRATGLFKPVDRARMKAAGGDG